MQLSEIIFLLMYDIGVFPSELGLMTALTTLQFSGWTGMFLIVIYCIYSMFCYIMLISNVAF